MFSTFISVISPLISLVILILGNGFFISFVVVRLGVDGVSPFMIAAMSAIYYLGLVVGSFRIEPFIVRVGHIRAYATFASLVTTTVLLQALYLNPWFWLLLRLINGYCMAGLFITIESWLLAKSSQKTRGQVLSLYMVSFYAAQSAGQFFVKSSIITGFFPFLIAALLSSLSVVPLSMTRSITPSFEEPSVLNFIRLYRLSPVGIFGCVCSGLIMGTTYGLLPLYVTQTAGVDAAGVMMGITILGGMLFQYPVGKLSDIFDRRTIILIITLFTLLVSALLITPLSHWYLLQLFLLFLFGGFTFTIYPLSISYACDHLPGKAIIAATQGLLLAYSIGATVGPLMAPGLTHVLGPRGLFVYFLIIGSILTLLVVWRMLTSPGVPTEEQKEFIAIPRTTPVGAELNPRQNKKLRSS